jgi:cell division inhibitor SulA
MQFPHSPNCTQLPLFDAFLAATAVNLQETESDCTDPNLETAHFSQVSLSGAADQCMNLLAMMLRELSDKHDGRWLTLIAPPANLNQSWLREGGLNRERILVLQPRGQQSDFELAQQALSLGRSHTVVSWLHSPCTQSCNQLEHAAMVGKAQSLNISLKITTKTGG